MSGLRKFIERDHYDAKIFPTKKIIKIGAFFKKISVKKHLKHTHTHTHTHTHIYIYINIQRETNYITYYPLGNRFKIRKKFINEIKEIISSYFPNVFLFYCYLSLRLSRNDSCIPRYIPYCPISFHFTFVLVHGSERWMILSPILFQKNLQCVIKTKSIPV